MRAVKKILWRLAIGIGVVISLVVGLAPVLAIWPDAAPPDDAGMLPVWKKTSGSGPLADFQKWLRKYEALNSDGKMTRLLNDGNWNSREAEALLQKYAAVLDQYVAFSETDPLTWSWLDAPDISI